MRAAKNLSIPTPPLPKDPATTLLPATSSENQKHAREKEEEEIVAQKRIKMEQTVEGARKVAGNIVVEKQLEEQSRPREKTSLFDSLKGMLDFPVSEHTPAPLPAKPKKGKKNAKQGKKGGKDQKTPTTKKQKKPALAKPKYNCECSDNVEQR